MFRLNIDHVLHDNILNVLNFFGFTHRCFFVGGMVRDNVLGKLVNDIDIVIANVSQKEISELNTHLTLTGKDFPVFRFRVVDSNQVEHEIELAVARIERSTGYGHSDYEVSFGEDISLEDDLVRRDLTFNAMAVPVMNLRYLVDLFNGVQDLTDKIIRHTSDAFAEDPLRVFRVARFLTRFEGFTVHPTTVELCRDINFKTAFLDAERISLELGKLFKSSKKPSVFFRFLKDTDNLQIWFPEIFNMIGIPQPEKYHGTNDVFDHTMETIDNASMFTNDFNILMGALFHDIGKTLTPDDILPAHHGHENSGATLVNEVIDRLKLSNNTKKVIFDSVKNHMKIGRTLEMKNRTVLKMVQQLKRNDTFHDSIAVSHADRLRDGGLSCDIMKKLHFAEMILSEKLPLDIVQRLTGKNGEQCQQIVLSFRLKRFNELYCA